MAGDWCPSFLLLPLGVDGFGRADRIRLIAKTTCLDPVPHRAGPGDRGGDRVRWRIACLRFESTKSGVQRPQHAERMKELGQRVVLFNPLDPSGRTARYNPLSYIDRRNPVEVINELQKIAVMLFPDPLTGDKFWAEGARTAFLGVCGSRSKVAPLITATGKDPAEIG